MVKCSACWKKVNITTGIEGCDYFIDTSNNEKHYICQDCYNQSKEG